MNVFALSEHGPDELIYRVPLSQEVQGILDEQFAELAEVFLADKEVIQFDGSYNASDDEVFVIENFPLNQEMIQSAHNSLNYDILDLQELQELGGRIKAIYATHVHNGQVSIYGQVFDTRKILANKGIPLINNNGTYTRFNNTGIVIHNKLTLIYQNGHIYFDSYWNARRIVDLAEYYQEATNDEVEEFVGLQILEIVDQVGFYDDLNSNLRKKIKAIQDRQALDGIEIDEIEEKANELGIDLQIANGRIVVPRDKLYVKNMVKFLDEDYWITPLTHRRCVTNSKREIQAD